MERLNDHRHVHNQCARARGNVHIFDFCYDWIDDGDRGVQICIIEPGAFIRHASMLTVAPTGAADMFVNWRARHGRESKVIKSHVGTKMKEKPVVYELLKITNR